MNVHVYCRNLLLHLLAFLISMHYLLENYHDDLMSAILFVVNFLKKLDVLILNNIYIYIGS